MPGHRDQDRSVSFRNQWDLNKCYGNNLRIDGQYGNLTRGAVREVQHYHNVYGSPLGQTLVEDGWAGPNTRRAMMHVVQEAEWCEHAWLDPTTKRVGLVPGYEDLSYTGPQP